MSFKKYLLPLMLAMGLSTSLQMFAAVPIVQDRHQAAYEEELDERDILALKEFVYSKRTIDVEEKDKNLTISGDVRSAWRHIRNKVNGVNVTGPFAVDDKGVPRGRNRFDVAFNVYFDYVAENAWATAQVEYDNYAGVDDNGFDCDEDPRGYHGSGQCDDVCLKKAFMGYNFFGDYYGMRLDIEVGRRNLYNVFDSNIQFLSRFDGILVKFTNRWDCVADMYIKYAVFVVDYRVNHYAWAAEAGALNISNTGFDVKYSFIDWVKRGRNRCFVENPAGFWYRNSQVTLIYNLAREYLCMPARLYGAFLYNHYPNYLNTTKNKRHGWYAGFIVGEIEKEGDVSLEVEYQVVQANAIPDDDVSGIGRGNVLGESYTVAGRGNGNYKGWRFEALYALTDNLTLDTRVQFSTPEDKKIGGPDNYSEIKIQAIYAW